MTDKGFKMAMMNLVAYYSGFEFPLVPDKSDIIEVSRYNVWFDVFKELSDEDFMTVVKSYCTTNIFAPTSPTPLIEKLKELKAINVPSDEAAWEVVSNALPLGIKGYHVMGNKGQPVYVNDFFKALESHPIIRNVCLEIESTLRAITTDNRGYVKNEFKQVYRRHAQNTVQLGYNEKLKLT